MKNLFYENKKTSIHLREIARKTKLNENSATRFLKILEKEDLLKSIFEGNLRKYSITSSRALFALFSIFDIERFGKLPGLRKDAVDFFMSALPEKPIIAVLFGSTAKGSYTKESDIDILLIVNKKINTEKAEDYADSQTGIKISCFQINYLSFQKELKLEEDKVFASAINTGYPITNHVLYYSEVLN